MRLHSLAPSAGGYCEICDPGVGPLPAELKWRTVVEWLIGILDAHNSLTSGNQIRQFGFCLKMFDWAESFGFFYRDVSISRRSGLALEQGGSKRGRVLYADDRQAHVVPLRTVVGKGRDLIQTLSDARRGPANSIWAP